MSSGFLLQFGVDSWHKPHVEMAAETDKDKRKEHRIPVDLWIEAEREGELYYQRAGNLSVGGAFFVQTIPLPINTRVALKFTLPGDTHEIVCEGDIVSAKELGMGVQFVNMQDVDRARLEKIIDRVVAQLAKRAAK